MVATSGASLLEMMPILSFLVIESLPIVPSHEIWMWVGEDSKGKAKAKAISICYPSAVWSRFAACGELVPSKWLH